MMFSTYYENNEAAEIPIPQNYSAVVGNPDAKSQADVPAGSGAKWFCEGDKQNEYENSAAFPQKACRGNLQTLLYFHDCVNPITLKSSYSGRAFGTANQCPRDMKRMPRLRFSIRYNFSRALPGGWTDKAPLTLSCGSSYCAHGDFIMGWYPEAAKNMLRATGKSSLKIVSGEKGNGYQKPTCKARDRDPRHGTSDYATALKEGGHVGM